MFLFFVFLFLINICLIFFVVRNEFRMKRLLKGNHIADLEKSLINTEKELKDIHAFRAYAEKQLLELTSKVRRGARKIGLVRFNPFGQKGGTGQSFAAAFLNEEGDGVVFSGLHIRDRVTLFAKLLVKNKSEHELSLEEKKAIQQAHTMYDEE
ncbi:MAG: DUF4446 family protein [bacterium]|nr:DUF4446 family protein [bacterium]